MVCVRAAWVCEVRCVGGSSWAGLLVRVRGCGYFFVFCSVFLKVWILLLGSEF